jgi:hypothetical protein
MLPLRWWPRMAGVLQGLGYFKLRRTTFAVQVATMAYLVALRGAAVCKCSASA